MSEFTNLTDEADLFDQQALLERLTTGLAGSDRRIIFVLGSALTAPIVPGGRGVCGVDEVINIIASEFSTEQRSALDRDLSNSENRYQEAFRFLLGRRGPQAPGQIIRRAVSAARDRAAVGGSGYVLNGATTEEACRGFEADVAGWHLTPGARAVGELAVGHPRTFGQTILTTNFDPLIEVAITAAGGHYFRTVMHGDGNLLLTSGDGAHVVHLHGYWYGSDTLHTPRQLNQPRPQLRSSLSHLLRNQIVVVLAYGGWDDAFTQALVEVAMDDGAFPEIIWCFRDAQPSIRGQLLRLLRPGLDRGRISFYAGVDCHVFLPALVDGWSSLEPTTAPRRLALLRPAPRSKTDVTDTPLGKQIPRVRPALLSIEENGPPVLEHYVGRGDDLSRLETAAWRVAFITGIGGQGKSALAAAFFNRSSSIEDFDHRLWRDCKEVSEKFEDQLIEIIEALNDGRVLSSELAKQRIEDLADLFCSLTEDLRLLVIFDNVDHYVDLGNRRLVGPAGAFIERFLTRPSLARLLFTCRPEILPSGSDVQARRVEGLTLDDARELFRLRNAQASVELLAEAHERTGGHALWLDLLAAQVASRKTVRLEDLLQKIQAGSGEIPDATLRSIWQTLRHREQVVLQALAETLRPSTRTQVTDFVRSKLDFQQTGDALRALRRQNLLVIKNLDEAETGFELHPVIRAFIHKTFERSDRKWYIDAILSFYSRFFGIHLPELNRSPAPAVVRRWLEGAELCVNAGRFGDAFRRLDEVRAALRRNASPVEFVRVTQYLLTSVETKDWRDHPQFDAVFRTYHRSLVNLGRLKEASEAIEQYHQTLQGKDARFINYCDMQTYMHWMHGEYAAAIEWGTEGADLKASSGVDTQFSSAHNLALAQRDSGAIDPALIFFLDGEKLEDVLEPGSLDKDRGGAFYGNIGRCLHLMGQIDPALVCYAKSAQLIESEHKDSDVENQAYIRQWIGELLKAKGEADAALFFMRAALEKWLIVSPPKAAVVQRAVAGTAAEEDVPTAREAERFALGWIKAGGHAD